MMRRFARETKGAALVEFTLALPLLIALAAGVTEMGLLLHEQHVVTKSLRDAARFAARTPLPTATCPLSGQPEWAGIIDATRTVAMRGKLDINAPLLVPALNDPNMISVAETCIAPAGLGSPATGGIPVITVSADVPHQGIGFLSILGLTNVRVQSSHSQMWVGL